MTDLPKRLEAAGRREAERHIDYYIDSGHFRDPWEAKPYLTDGFRHGHTHLHPLIQKMAEALEKISVSSEGFYTEEKVMSEGHTEMEILDVDKIARDALSELEKYLGGV